MNYKCKKCGGEFVTNGKMTKCQFCDLTLAPENDASGTFKKQLDALSRIENIFKETGDATELKSLLSDWKNYSTMPGFSSVWRKLIIGCTGVADKNKDKDLQSILKNHAREFDAQTQGSDLFITLLKSFPKLGTLNDWEDLIQRTHGDETQFAVICDSIIYCIIKGKSKSFAVEVFNLFDSKKDEWVDAGRKYVRALLSNEDISRDIFPVSAFNGATRKFASKLKSYCNKYLNGDHSIALEQTKVWENYAEAEKKRKKRNMVITSITCGVVVCVALAVFIFTEVIA